MSVTARALWHIESHLDSDLSLEAIAEASGVSRFHLSRAFGASTGQSLAGYVRGRRLGQAARALAGGASDIMSLALEAGYGSHEAFTRAFKQQFGLSPEQVRSQANLQDLKLQEPGRMEPSTITTLSTPRLVRRGALLIFGLGQRCPAAGHAGIPSQWNRFVLYIGQIEGQAGSAAYGAIYNADDSGTYDYVCGVRFASFRLNRRSSRGFEFLLRAMRSSSIANTYPRSPERSGQSGSMG